MDTSVLVSTNLGPDSVDVPKRAMVTRVLDHLLKSGPAVLCNPCNRALRSVRSPVVASAGRIPEVFLLTTGGPV